MLEVTRARRRMMALRIRKDGRILCAAHHQAQDGDVYIDDGQHYRLSVEIGVLVAEPMPRHADPTNPHYGEWWWESRVPDDVSVEYLTDEVHLTNEAHFQIG